MTKTEIFKLYERLRFLGFSPDFFLRGDLEMIISEYWPAFELSTTANFGDQKELQVDLHFVKSAEKDAHYLHKYRATLLNPADPAMDRSQTFGMTEGMQVKLKEAYNLLLGRAIFKEIVAPKGDKYFAWVQLNFREKDAAGDFKLIKVRSRHSYELANVLNKYPIRELVDSDLKEVILQALKSGERRIVTFLRPSGKADKKIIEANPMLKTINIYAVPKATRKGQLGDFFLPFFSHTRKAYNSKWRPAPDALRSPQASEKKALKLL